MGNRRDHHDEDDDECFEKYLPIFGIVVAVIFIVIFTFVCCRSCKRKRQRRDFRNRIIRLPAEPAKVPPPYQISGNLASAPIYQLSPYQLQHGHVPSAPHAVQGEVIHPPAYQQVHQNHTQQGYNPNFNNV